MKKKRTRKKARARSEQSPQKSVMSSHDVFFIFVYFLAIIVLLSLLLYDYWQTKPTIEEGTRLGDRAPLFDTTYLGGQHFSLKDLRGKPVVLNFWATWCPPCVKEMKYLQRVQDAHLDELVVVGINMGQDEKRIHRFLAIVEVDFPIILDKENKIQEKYNIVLQPSTYFIDEEGMIVDKKLGEMSQKGLNQRVQALLE